MNDEPMCERCHCLFTVEAADEVTKYCNNCAHVLVEAYEDREQLMQKIGQVMNDHIASIDMLREACRNLVERKY
jgi:PHP family Zn ribbon phosphoesterase